MLIPGLKELVSSIVEPFRIIVEFTRSIAKFLWDLLIAILKLPFSIVKFFCWDLPVGLLVGIVQFLREIVLRFFGPVAPLDDDISSPRVPPLLHAPGLAPDIVLGGLSKVIIFTYEELAMATDGFSDDNLLGQGGFGVVHRGTLPDGKQVAIKKLISDVGKGESQFRSEVEIISRLHHKHLVSLVGYCIEKEQRILVYEYVPNKTLKFHLRGKEGAAVDWPTRIKIALSSAKGLAYLHEDCFPKIIHRDVKPDNILLDHNFEAKIADFGLAAFFPDEMTYIEVTRVMGTIGYIDPECFYSWKFTDKSDVYAFGVVVLELITGRRAVVETQSSGACSLVEWARPLMEVCDYEALIDPQLQNNYNADEMVRLVASAAACVRRSPTDRPQMGQIVRALEGNLSLENLNGGIIPGSPEHISLSISNDTTEYSGSSGTNIQEIRINSDPRNQCVIAVGN